MSLFFSCRADFQQWLHQIKIHLQSRSFHTFVIQSQHQQQHMDTLSSSGVNLFLLISLSLPPGESYKQNKYEAPVANQTRSETAYFSGSSIDNLEGFLLLN